MRTYKGGILDITCRRLRELRVILVFLVLLGLASPIWGQEEGNVSGPPSQVTEGGSVKQTPEPKTVGELLEREALVEQATKTDMAPKEPSSSPKIHLPDRKKPDEHWATNGDVGESTFVDKLITVCWALAFVSLLVWGSAKLASKTGLKQMGVSSGTDKKTMIELLEKKRLSPGRSVLLMKVGPKVLALAATESGYETLTEFDGEEFRKYQDSSGRTGDEKEEQTTATGATTPTDIARHYLSIIPGTGTKK